MRQKACKLTGSMATVQGSKIWIVTSSHFFGQFAARLLTRWGYQTIAFSEFAAASHCLKQIVQTFCYPAGCLERPRPVSLYCRSRGITPISPLSSGRETFPPHPCPGLVYTNPGKFWKCAGCWRKFCRSSGLRPLVAARGLRARSQTSDVD